MAWWARPSCDSCWRRAWPKTVYDQHTSPIHNHVNIGSGADVTIAEVAQTIAQIVGFIDPRYFRPTEVETLLGDPSKAKAKLGWVPEITAQEMCKEMVVHDLQVAKQHATLKANGFQVNVSME